MIIEQIFSAETIIMNLKSSTKDFLFEEMVNVCKSVHPSVNVQEAVKSLKEREAQMTTGLMHQVGIPHGYCDGIEETYGVIGISKDGIDYASLDGDVVNVVFMLICPKGDSKSHLLVLKEIAALLQKTDFIKNILSCSNADEVMSCING